MRFHDQYPQKPSPSTVPIPRKRKPSPTMKSSPAVPKISNAAPLIRLKLNSIHPRPDGGAPRSCVSSKGRWGGWPGG
ncbi:hypothetical protein AYI69_g3701 [Smittium culicis]|uniref:Uncharacterized protein n=1 Tax=Smittium culicis TaxID=133412 RepID=A0A1R1YJ01_9FUNG|nr:hypothetical protein AYI69_g3701 [Smittium culicis]